MKLTEYKMKYAKSDRQIDMTGARLTPVRVLLRLYAEYKDDSVFVLLCGDKAGIKGFVRLPKDIDQIELNRETIKAATDAKVSTVIVGARHDRPAFKDMEKTLKAHGIHLLNGIIIGKDSYYLFHQDQVYRYGD